MKFKLKPKPELKAKPGDLLETRIKYGANGGASVMHTHEPEPPPKHGPWMPQGTPMEHNFTSRAEAHLAAAKHAGVEAVMDDAEDQAEAAKGKKPSKKEEMAEGEEE